MSSSRAPIRRMGAVLEALKACGMAVERQKTGVRLCRDGRLRPLDLTITSLPPASDGPPGALHRAPSDTA